MKQIIVVIAASLASLIIPLAFIYLTMHMIDNHAKGYGWTIFAAIITTANVVKMIAEIVNGSKEKE